jgi:hypothetical protein
MAIELASPTSSRLAVSPSFARQCRCSTSWERKPHRRIELFAIRHQHGERRRPVVGGLDELVEMRGNGDIPVR